MSPPVSDGSGLDRKLLQKASRLLDQAGWKLNGPLRRNDKGEPLRVEFLLDDPAFERIIGPYVQSLRRIGVDASIRIIDDAQYRQPSKDFDFDTLTQRFGLGQTPGTELRAFFGSAAASAHGSYNLAGVKSPAVDGLIDKVTQAKSRNEQGGCPVARPGAARHALLGAALAQGEPHRRLLGRVRQAGDQAEI